MVEGPQQFRAFAVLDHILGKLANVQVVRDEVIDASNLAIGQGLPQFHTSLPALDVFPPSFRWQRQLVAFCVLKIRFAEVVAFLEHAGLGIVHAVLHKIRQGGFQDHLALGIKYPAFDRNGTTVF